MMSGIRSKNTKPEIMVRRLLHGMGFRFRLHAGDLPGKPDIVLARYRAVVFIHGCFWHGHHCPLFRLPSTRTAFWETKIEGNRRNDLVVCGRLLLQGWRIATLWECSFRGSGVAPEEIVRQLAAWLRGDSLQLELKR